MLFDRKRLEIQGQPVPASPLVFGGCRPECGRRLFVDVQARSYREDAHTPACFDRVNHSIAPYAVLPEAFQLLPQGLAGARIPTESTERLLDAAFQFRSEVSNDGSDLRWDL